MKALLGYYDKEGCCFTLYGALNCEVEIIEEQQDIDIQAIEELKQVTVHSETYQSVYDNREKVNELIQAVKQLDRKIREEE